jgi:cytochrome c556
MKYWVTKIILVGLLISASSQAATQDDIIDYRYSVMRVIKWDFGILAAMVKGEIPFDAKKFSRYATRVHTLSDMVLEGFTDSSHINTDEVKRSGALAKIWQQGKISPAFDKHIKDFQDKTGALVKAAESGNLRKIRAAFGATANTCKSCHDDFRKKT